MHEERLWKLADHIEDLPHDCAVVTPLPDYDSFSMGEWLIYGKCGTVGCIAGWAVDLFHDDPENVDNLDVEDEAKRLLGLSDREAYDLFLAGDWDLRLGRVTPGVAAGVIRDFVETGDVDWDEEMQRQRDNP